MPAARPLELKDGSRVLVRPIEPGDRDALLAGFERMSPESRYRRFFSPISRLSDSQLDYLTRVDHHDHEALLALDAAGEGAVAVARFVRVGEGVAEPAVAVVDDWQGRGLATALLEALVARAREEGVDRFAAPILADNAAAIAAFERLGDTTVNRSGPEVELLIELPPGDGAPAGLQQALRGVAGRSLRPAVSFLQRLATGRGESPAALANAVVAAAERPSPDDPAVAAAAELAAALAATLHLVVAQPLLLESGEQLERALAATSERLSASGVVAVESHLRRGDLGAATIDVAVEQRARLIVVDGSDRAPPARLVGSVWDHLAHHAPCAVLIARRL
jgi:GNAT superfamily N-acetyltransferase